jgi:serine protease Do
LVIEKLKNNQMSTKQFSMLLLAASLSTAAFAQKEEKQIIINDGKKTETLNVQVDGDKVTINGVPAENWKDGDLEKLNNKKIKVQVHGKNGMEFSMPDFEVETEVKMGNGAFLGVMTEKADKGVKVTEVTKESAAAKAGLQNSDIITKINDTQIETSTDLVNAIHSFKPDSKINITFLRDNKEKTTSAVLGKRKETDIKTFKMNGGDFNFHMPNMPQMERSFPFEYHNNNGGGKPRLGIEIQDLEEGSGVKVTDVDNDMAAGKSGLKEDDIITELNSKEVKSVDDLRAKLKELKEGEAFKVGIKRNGKSQTIDIKYPKRLKTANL